MVLKNVNTDYDYFVLFINKDKALFWILILVRMHLIKLVKLAIFIEQNLYLTMI